MKKYLLFSSFAVLISVPLFFAACATAPSQRTAEMSKEISAQSATVSDLQHRVDAMNVILTDLQTPGKDLRPVFAAYSDEVDKIRKAGNRSRGEYADMLDTRDAYVADFRTEHKKLTDPTLRQAAETRYSQTMANYDLLTNRSDSMQAAYNIYLSDLEQIRTFLSTDITAEGVARIAPTIQRARADGESLKASAQAYQTALNEVSGSISPVYR